MGTARMVRLATRATDRLAERSYPERGATATEYAILVGFIAIVIVAGLTLFGSSLEHWFSTMAGQLP